MKDNNKDNMPKKDGHMPEDNVFQYLEVPYSQTKSEIWEQLS